MPKHQGIPPFHPLLAPSDGIEMINRTTVPELHGIGLRICINPGRGVLYMVCMSIDVHLYIDAGPLCERLTTSSVSFRNTEGS
jgi:hypothetical protein